MYRVTELGTNPKLRVSDGEEKRAKPTAPPSAVTSKKEKESAGGLASSQ